MEVKCSSCHHAHEIGFGTQFNRGFIIGLMFKLLCTQCGSEYLAEIVWDVNGNPVYLEKVDLSYIG